MPGERGLSGYNRKFNDTLTVTYKLPTGHGWARYIYGGWNTSMINSMFSGQPVNLTWSPAANSQISGVLNYRPNQTGEANLEGGDPNNYLDRTTVTVPDAQHPYGTAGRNTAKSAPTYQTDLRIQKDFPLHWEKSRLSFQAECFNVWNKTNFRAPNANRSNSNYGTITSTFAPRIMQFALRFSF